VKNSPALIDSDKMIRISMSNFDSLHFFAIVKKEGKEKVRNTK